MYVEILLFNSLKFSNSVYLQESSFRWLVSGPIRKGSTEQKVDVNNCNLENQLRLIWEQEELVAERKRSQEEELCEAFFAKTYKRDANRHFNVQLLF